MQQHQALSLKTYSKDTVAFVASNEPWQVDLQAPAASVMTDFRERAVFQADAGERIDEALQRMKHAGLRAAFVVEDGSGRLLGMVTAYDIMGEKPMRYLESVGAAGSGMARRDVRVADVMEAVGDWTVAEMRQVAHSNVASVIEALHKSGRTHLPVMEAGPDGEPHLRGLFSSSKILRLTQHSRGKSAGAPA